MSTQSCEPHEIWGLGNVVEEEPTSCAAPARLVRPPLAVSVQLRSIRRRPPRISVAGEIAINNRSEVLIHRPDGGIREA